MLSSTAVSFKNFRSKTAQAAVSYRLGGTFVEVVPGSGAARSRKIKTTASMAAASPTRGGFMDCPGV
jgi:hypothetical protein